VHRCLKERPKIRIVRHTGLNIRAFKEPILMHLRTLARWNTQRFVKEWRLVVAGGVGLGDH
jgi:hypothetical protein